MLEHVIDHVWTHTAFLQFLTAGIRTFVLVRDFSMVLFRRSSREKVLSVFLYIPKLRDFSMVLFIWSKREKVQSVSPYVPKKLLSSFLFLLV